MNKYAEIRREKLRQIVEEMGLAAAARRFGKPDRQINDMLAKRKSFGERVAREMEEVFAPDLPAGWLDEPMESVKDLVAVAQPQPQPELSDISSALDLASQAADIGGMWLQLPEAARDSIRAQIEAELRHKRNEKHANSKEADMEENRPRRSGEGVAWQTVRPGEKKTPDGKSGAGQ